MASKTGTQDATYNVVSVLYHALQGADLYDQYCDDAQQDQQLSQFFRNAQQQQKQIAEQAKDLLAERLGEKQMR